MCENDKKYYCVGKEDINMKFSKFNLIIKNEENDNYILYNTLQGHCIEVEKNIKEVIEARNFDMLDAGTVELFVKYGMIINDEIDENRIFSYFHSVEKYASKAINSTVLLTWSCNLKCIYCFEGKKENSASMNTNQADKYIEFIILLAKTKKAESVTINLFGGEPLVNIEIGYYILTKIKAYCEQNGIAFMSSIITNGTLLTEEVLYKLLNLNCKTIQVTLDGVKEIHDSRRMDKKGNGTFDRILKVLAMLNKKIEEHKSFNTVIRINIDKLNISDTFSLLRQIGKNNLNLTNCTIDFGIVRGLTDSCSAYSNNCFAEEELGEILYDLWNAAEKEGFFYNIRPIRRWMYCGLYSDGQYTVTPECEVYKCWEHAGEKEHQIGSLDDEGNLVDIRYAFYDWMTHNPLDNDECQKCVYLPNCGGGCGLVSYAKTGTYHGVGCFKIKGVVEKQLMKYIEKCEK